MGRFLATKIAPFVNHGIVVCTNPETATEYDWLPENFVVKMYSDQLIEDIMKFQEDNGKPPAFLYLDDQMGSVDLGSQTIKKLYSQYRKYKMFLWVGVQYLAKLVPPALRNCMTHIYAFRQDQERALRMEFEAFFSPFFETFQHFRMVNNRLPQYSCFWKDEEGFEGNATLNIVKAPDPKTAPEFYMDWRVLPPDEDKDKEEAEPDAPLPASLSHLYATRERLGDRAQHVGVVEVPHPASIAQRGGIVISEDQQVQRDLNALVQHKPPKPNGEPEAPPRGINRPAQQHGASFGLETEPTYTGTKRAPVPARIKVPRAPQVEAYAGTKRVRGGRPPGSFNPLRGIVKRIAAQPRNKI